VKNACQVNLVASRSPRSPPACHVWTRRLGARERAELTQLAGGTTLQNIAGGIVVALDPDTQLAAARGASAAEEPTVEEIATAARGPLDQAVAALATNPELRERIVEMRNMHEQVIDDSSSDEVIETSDSVDATDRARHTVESWEQFCHENRDGIAALQILYGQRPPQRLTFSEKHSRCICISLAYPGPQLRRGHSDWWMPVRTTRPDRWKRNVAERARNRRKRRSAQPHVGGSSQSNPS
jgi:hypothetical protein